MRGFADLHTHILPGVDDGAANVTQAWELVRAAYANGTRRLFLTPHYRGAYRKTGAQALQETFRAFSQIVAEELPDLQLYLGCEVHYESAVPELLSQGKILTLNGSSYVLLEFSSAAMSSQILNAVSETLRHGFTPIIAHAERYRAFHSDPKLIGQVLEMGALIQLNADSVMGSLGFRVKRFCHRLLKAGSVHFIASDAHDDKHRPPSLRECYLYVRKKYGAEYAAGLFFDNAEAVIENR